jgi:hypothetical protein
LLSCSLVVVVVVGGGERFSFAHLTSFLGRLFFNF